MAKYEIMLILSEKLNEKEASDLCMDLSKHLNVKIEVTKLGFNPLAYQINKNTKGHYFQLNFNSEDIAGINEFRRLTTINKNVLRHLIINLEKDYGYRATINPKKIARSKKTAEIYAQKQIEFKRRQEEYLKNKEEYLKNKEERMNKPYEKKSYSDSSNSGNK
jgi:small subunit ribosomal protein S6